MSEQDRTPVSDDAGRGRRDSADRAHVARVRMCQAYLARQILAIPATVSPHGRRIRIGQATRRMFSFTRRFSESYSIDGRHTIRVTDHAISGHWIDAGCDAARVIEAALEAGDDLAAFVVSDPEDEHADLR